MGIGALTLSRLKDLLPLGIDCVIASALPVVAENPGAIVSAPPREFARCFFSAVGSYVPVEDDEAFAKFTSVFSLMGDMYQRQLTIQKWLASHGIEPRVAASWT